MIRDNPDKIWNGIGTYSRELSKALRARGHEVEWFIGGTDYGTVKLGAKIPKDFDLVEAILPYGGRVKLPLVARCNSPLKEEARWYPSLKRFKGFLGQFQEVFTLEKAKAVISVSQFSHDILLEKYGAESVIIPDAVDCQWFRPTKGEYEKPLIATSKRRELRKNLKAIETAELYTAGRVEWTREPQPADIFFAPSFSEGFDISLLEAMASSCACLVSDIPAHRELVRYGVDGYFFSSETEMKGLLDLLIQSKELRTMLGNNARKKALDYTWERCAKAHEAVFDNALGLPAIPVPA